MRRTWTALAAAGVIVIGGAVPAAVTPRARATTNVPRAVPMAIPAGFAPVGPVRIVDTRTAEVGPLGRVPAGGTVVVDVGAVAGVPAGSLVAAAVNLTAVEVDGPGHVTAWPTGRAQPFVSNLNVPGRGAIVPNFAIVPLGADETFSVQPNIGTDLVVDLAGVFVATSSAVSSGRLTTLAPARLLDTRDGTGGRTGPLELGGSFDLQVTGRAGIPAGATAAVLAVTATEAHGPGFVSAWPTGAPQPFVSALNVPGAGATVTNLTIAPIGARGQVSFFSQSGTHLVVDVVGWMSGAGAPAATIGLFVPNGPDRQLDSRTTGRGLLAGRMRADLPLRLPAGLSAPDVAAVAANVTVTDTTGGLYLTAYPARTRRPLTAILTADRAAQTVGSFSIVPTGANATISLYPMVRTHVVVDAAGYFLGAPAPSDVTLAPVGPDPRGASLVLGGFDDEIETFLADTGYAGASVAVAKDGRVVYAKAYGSANAATGERLRLDHHFRVASLSKVLTAVTVQQLIAEGALSSSTAVWPLLADRVPVPAGADPRLGSITVRQLLGHTSGFVSGPEPFFNDHATIRSAFGANGASSCEQAARWYVGLPLAHDPGTKYTYVNMNYCLLSLLVEEVTGSPWETVVRERTQVPRDVVDMYLGRTYQPQSLDVAHVTPAPGEPGGGWFMESLAGAGSWMGTPVDMVRILDGLDPAKPGADLLTASSLAAMRARPSTDPGDASVWYGLGLINFRSGAAYGHTGSLQGTRTMMVHEANGVTWCIMVNARFADHGDVLLSLMDRALARVAQWPSYDLGPDLP
jgi:CubicO group peptidase (beta-lactamase class C family)